MQRPVGLHVRAEQHLHEAIEKITALQLPIAQFFVRTMDGAYLIPTAADLQAMHALRATSLTHLVIHGSYRINLASPSITHHPAFEREWYIAQKLECTHFLLHAGSAHHLETGLQALAHHLNRFMKKETSMHVVLENVAFAEPSIGGTFEHFTALLEYLDKPEQLSFCIDTAHAYAAGYTFDEHGEQNILTTIEHSIGSSRIAFLHINDTTSACGSHIDQHATLGAGTIGTHVLKTFACHPSVVRCPIILELPPLQKDEEIRIINEVQSWKTR